MRRGAENFAAFRGAFDAGDAPPAAVRSGVNSFWARITGSASVGDNRWEYEWEIVALSDDGDWEVPIEEVTSATMGPAHNTLEAANSATGLQGNGVVIEDLCVGATIQPVAEGSVHLLRGPFGSAAAPIWIFSSPNGVNVSGGGP